MSTITRRTECSAVGAAAPSQPDELRDHDARAETNRANARHSTGPRTAEGRAHSRWNALTHGLYARTLQPGAEALGEAFVGYQTLREALLDEYAPQGLQEERLVERMALLMWRQDRLFVQGQRTLAAASAAADDAEDPLLASERYTSAEIRLDRAILRLHKDLLFLARYRARARQEEAKREARRKTAPLQERLAALADILQSADGFEETTEAVSPEGDAVQETAEPGSPREPLSDSLAQFLFRGPTIGTREWQESAGTKPSNGRGSGMAHTG